MKIKFPEDFKWGSSFSGPQTEGAAFEDGKSPTIWDEWFRINKSRFYEQNFVKNNFYHNYKEDIKLAKQANFNSLRTSIQWSRLIPDGKTINQKAVDFYRNVFSEMKKQKQTVSVNLFHFDTPLWAQKLGGFENREIVDKYVFYAKTCFKLFNDLVDIWYTFNEPIVTVECGYLYDYHYPNILSFKKANLVYWNILIAHFKAVAEFRKIKSKSKIGIILNITPAIPRSQNKEDLDAAI